MDDSTDGDVEQAFDLIDSLDQDWLKIPLLAMKEVGPAAQTLAGILKITNKETFVTTARIAAEAGVSPRTCEKHLRSLVQHGWLVNGGRGRASNGRPRRTATRTLTPKSQKSVESYAILPWWACCDISRFGKLTWSAKAVLSIVMSRLATLKSAAQDAANNDGGGDVVDWIESYLDVEERFRFSLTYLRQQTGLSRESIVTGKRELHRMRIVDWIGGDSGVDCIPPRWDLRIVQTPTEPGFVRVSFNNTEG